MADINSYLKEDCVFCMKILDGSAMSFGLDAYTFIPINPVTEGHRLFIPSSHVEKDTVRYDDWLGFIFRDAATWGTTQNTDYNLIINLGSDASQTIDHLHVHYVPRRPQDGLILPWTGQKH